MCGLVKVVANNGALLLWLLCEPRKLHIIYTRYVYMLLYIYYLHYSVYACDLCVYNSVRRYKQFSHFHKRHTALPRLYFLYSFRWETACERCSGDNITHIYIYLYVYRWIKNEFSCCRHSRVVYSMCVCYSFGYALCKFGQIDIYNVGAIEC